MPPAPERQAPVGDRDVERDPVHPGGEAARLVKGGVRAPQLGADFLGEIPAVLGVPAERVRDLENDAAMPGEEGLEAGLVGSVHNV